MEMIVTKEVFTLTDPSVETGGMAWHGMTLRAM